MSRSKRKHPYIKFSGRSDKFSKVVAHRKYTTKDRTCLHRLEILNQFSKIFPEMVLVLYH